jgi:sterol desaturase/sphingolipid hydroxylase (fatty acid hydroxylase superfamily)
MSLESLAIFAAAALIFIPLERFFPLHRERGWLRGDTLTDVLHFFLTGFVIRVGTVATVLMLSNAAVSVVPAGLGEAIRAQPDWLEFAELLVLADLGFYLGHRLVHAVPWLWRFHAVHHSSEQLDWIATYRVHPVDQILNSTIIALPALILGFSPGPLLVYAFAYRWHAMLLHSNVRLDLGPLNRWIATPQYHHWHHADETQAYDRNFGGQLVIWDRLFGTCFEATRLPHRYGVGGEVPGGYPAQLLTPFRPPARVAEPDQALGTGIAA